MNKTIELILKRRSVRSFRDTAVEEDKLREIILSGRYAPSGGGNQAAIIALIQGDARDNLARINAEIWGKDKDPFWGAPIVLAVLADSRAPSYIEDGSAALENMIIAAESVGLNSCWVCRAKETFDTDYGRKMLKKVGIDPEVYVGIGFVVIGHGESKGEAHRRLEPLFYTIKEDD